MSTAAIASAALPVGMRAQRVAGASQPLQILSVVFLPTSEPMGKKTTTAALAIAVGAAAYFIRKYWRRRDGARMWEMHADACILHENYTDALELLENIPNKTPSVYYKMACCHESLGNLTDALVFLNICIGSGIGTDSPSLGCLERRYQIHRRAGLYREAFRDIFTLNMLDQEQKFSKEASECLKNYSARRASTHEVSGWASPVNFDEFFSGLAALIERLDGPVQAFLQSGEYRKCYEYVKGLSDPQSRFVAGCFEYVNGHVSRAIEMLSADEYLYSRLLCCLMRAERDSIGRRYSGERREGDGEETKADTGAADGTTGGSGAEAKELLAELSGSDDPTVLFCLARICGCLGSRNQELFFIDAAISRVRAVSFLRYKIVWLIKQGVYQEAEGLIGETVDEYPDDIHTVCIAVEYYLCNGGLDISEQLLSAVEAVSEGDPRVPVLRYMVSRAAGKADATHLRTAIATDPLYYKSYIYLGNQLMGSEESRQAYDRALENARSFDELYTAYQLKTVVDVQDELLRMYPSMFER